MVDKHLVEVVLESLRQHPPSKTDAESTTFTASDLKFHNMARLWAGMGYIYRVDVRGHTPRVVKHVRLPPSITSVGDQRKADSYHCEANFYQHVVPHLRHNHGVDLPETYHVERTERSVLIVMSFIDTIQSAYLNPNRTRLVLSWLARFHAATWGSQSTRLVQTHGLQALGTYWHLDTRPDEHASMSNKGVEGRLKMAARAIHERLQRDPCQSLVHGDAKEANLLFVYRNNHPQEEGVVLCDFQYCGRGTPAKDLAYFFCSSVDDLEEREGDYLEFYVAQLTLFLPHKDMAPAIGAMRDSLEWAYCDFARFMAGWGSWGNDLSDRVRAKLDGLDDGSKLGSEEAYCTAMLQRFG